MISLLSRNCNQECIAVRVRLAIPVAVNNHFRESCLLAQASEFFWSVDAYVIRRQGLHPTGFVNDGPLTFFPKSVRVKSAAGNQCCASPQAAGLFTRDSSCFERGDRDHRVHDKHARWLQGIMKVLCYFEVLLL